MFNKTVRICRPISLVAQVPATEAADAIDLPASMQSNDGSLDSCGQHTIPDVSLMVTLLELRMMRSEN